MLGLLFASGLCRNVGPLLRGKLSERSLAASIVLPQDISANSSDFPRVSGNISKFQKKMPLTGCNNRELVKVFPISLGE